MTRQQLTERLQALGFGGPGWTGENLTPRDLRFVLETVEADPRWLEWLERLPPPPLRGTSRPA